MQTVYANSYTVSPAQCTPQLRLSVQRLVQHLIETATDHAALLRFGSDDLGALGLSWVLGRVSLVMQRMPAIHEAFCIRTWVVSVNRHFTERAFAVITPDGHTLGHARTIWSAIHTDTRAAADLTAIGPIAACSLPQLPLPVDPMPRMAVPSAPDTSYDYLCRVTDLDFNRHMTTMRYVELMIGLLTLPELDAHTVQRLDLVLAREILYGQTVTVSRHDTPDGILCTLARPDGLCAKGLIKLN